MEFKTPQLEQGLNKLEQIRKKAERVKITGSFKEKEGRVIQETIQKILQSDWIKPWLPWHTEETTEDQEKRKKYQWFSKKEKEQFKAMLENVMQKAIKVCLRSKIEIKEEDIEKIGKAVIFDSLIIVNKMLKERKKIGLKGALEDTERMITHKDILDILKFLEDNPDVPEGNLWHCLVRSNDHQGKLDQAKINLNELKKNNPSDPKGKLGRFAFHHTYPQNSLEQAKSIFKDLQEKNPNTSETILWDYTLGYKNAAEVLEKDKLLLEELKKNNRELSDTLLQRFIISHRRQNLQKRLDAIKIRFDKLKQNYPDVCDSILWCIIICHSEPQERMEKIKKRKKKLDEKYSFLAEKACWWIAYTYTDTDEGVLKYLKELTKKPISIFAPRGKDKELINFIPQAEFLSPEDETVLQEEQEWLKEAINELTDKEKNLLEKYLDQSDIKGLIEQHREIFDKIKKYMQNKEGL
jgi:hypothetical protein